MATVAKTYTFVNGTTAEASEVNRDFDDLYSAVNGELNSANIIASGVDTVNINDGAVTPAKIAADFVIQVQVFS